MATTFYGIPNHISSTLIPPFDPVTTFYIHVSNTNRSLKDIILGELEIKRQYITGMDTLVVAMDEKHWTPTFIGDFETAIPSTVTRTFVRLIRPDAYELTYSFENARGTLDGFPRIRGDERAPVFAGVTLSMGLDALVEDRDTMVHTIRRHRDITLLEILPPYHTRRPQGVYFDAMMVILSTLGSSVEVSIPPALNWSREDRAEILWTLDNRPL